MIHSILLESLTVSQGDTMDHNVTQRKLLYTPIALSDEETQMGAAQNYAQLYNFSMKSERKSSTYITRTPARYNVVSVLLRAGSFSRFFTSLRNSKNFHAIAFQFYGQNFRFISSETKLNFRYFFSCGFRSHSTPSIMMSGIHFF